MGRLRIGQPDACYKDTFLGKEIISEDIPCNVFCRNDDPVSPAESILYAKMCKMESKPPQFVTAVTDKTEVFDLNHIFPVILITLHDNINWLSEVKGTKQAVLAF